MDLNRSFDLVVGLATVPHFLIFTEKLVMLFSERRLQLVETFSRSRHVTSRRLEKFLDEGVSFKDLL